MQYLWCMIQRESITSERGQLQKYSIYISIYETLWDNSARNSNAYVNSEILNRECILLDVGIEKLSRIQLRRNFKAYSAIDRI